MPKILILANIHSVEYTFRPNMTDSIQQLKMKESVITKNIYYKRKIK